MEFPYVLHRNTTSEAFTYQVSDGLTSETKECEIRYKK